jgi:phosphoglycerate dehydrogenase-like enzyme
MKNIKFAATAIVAVAVAGVSVKNIVTRAKQEKMVSETLEVIDNAVVDFAFAEIVAFNKAQDEVTDRMLAGYYDDKTDAEAQHDFAVLYANYLSM